KLLTQDEILRMLGAAGDQLRAMILLAVNAGLGNSDCSRICKHNLDLEKGWLDYPRAKTGVERRAPLWPETIEAIRHVLEKRREPKNPDDRDLVFVTNPFTSWPSQREGLGQVKHVVIPIERGSSRFDFSAPFPFFFSAHVVGSAN